MILNQLNTYITSPPAHFPGNPQSVNSKKSPSFTSAIKMFALPAMLATGTGLLVYEIKNNPKQLEENKEVAELNERIDKNNARIAQEKEAKMLKELDEALSNLAQRKTLDAKTCNWLIGLCNSDNMKDPKFARAVTNQLLKAQKAMLANMSPQEKTAFLDNQEKAYYFLKKKIAHRYVEANKSIVSAPAESPASLIADIRTVSSYQNPAIISTTKGNALTELEASEEELARPLSESDRQDFETIYTAVFESEKNSAIHNAQRPHYAPKKMPIPTTLPVYAGFLFLFLSGIIAVGELLGIGKED